MTPLPTVFPTKTRGVPAPRPQKEKDKPVIIEFPSPYPWEQPKRPGTQSSTPGTTVNVPVQTTGGTQTAQDPLQQVFGTKPTVPDVTQTSTTYAQQLQQMLPYIQQLAEQINQMVTQQTLAAREAYMPGYSGLSRQQSELLASYMAGRVPTDVQRMLAQQAAERGVWSGAPLSPASNAAYLRALGLTSLGLQQAGMEAFQRASAQLPSPEYLGAGGIATLLTGAVPSPSDIWQTQWLSNIIQAAPDPVAQALWQLLQNLGWQQFYLNLLGQGTQSGTQLLASLLR